MMKLFEGIRKSKQSMWFVMVSVLFSAIVVVSYFFLGAPAAHDPPHDSNLLQVENGDSEVIRILERAATAEKTVILTCLNRAWAEPNSVFDLFLESFKRGNNTKRLMKNMVVLSFDDKAHSHCLKLKLHCHFLQIQGFDFSGEAGFKSSNYLEIIWTKLAFLQSVLSFGYNFLFTDVDIMWFRDPFIHLQDDADFQIASDHYNGKPTDVHNMPNAGFMYVKSNQRTILFFKTWYYSRHLYAGKHEQEVFNVIKYSSVFNIIGLKVKFLDPLFFGGFCQSSRDFNQVCSMHANCCLGLKNKVHDLKLILDDWRKYSSLSPQENPPYPFKWSAPKLCHM